MALRARPSQAPKGTPPTPLSSLPQSSSLRPTTSPHPASSLASGQDNGMVTVPPHSRMASSLRSTTSPHPSSSSSSSSSFVKEGEDKKKEDKEGKKKEEEEEDDDMDVDVIPSPMHDNNQRNDNHNNDGDDNDEDEDGHHSFQPFRRLSSLDFAGALQVGGPLP